MYAEFVSLPLETGADLYVVIDFPDRFDVTPVFGTSQEALLSLKNHKLWGRRPMFILDRSHFVCHIDADWSYHLEPKAPIPTPQIALTVYPKKSYRTKDEVREAWYARHDFEAGFGRWIGKDVHLGNVIATLGEDAIVEIRSRGSEAWGHFIIVSGRG